MLPRGMSITGKKKPSVLEGEMNATVGDCTFKATLGTLVCLPRDVAHSFAIESEQLRTLILLTPAGLEGFFKKFNLHTAMFKNCWRPLPDIA